MYSISIFLSLAGAKARWPGYSFGRPGGCLPEGRSILAESDIDMQSIRDRLENILSRLANRAADEKVYTKLYAEAARAAASA
ncbi:MAG: hypothetical protein E5V51_11205 [Mesorhizobium sp.]|nr:MAG: hypothetical protein E5V51_11205 [Mesorhizobium sp.]